MIGCKKSNSAAELLPNLTADCVLTGIGASLVTLLIGVVSSISSVGVDGLMMLFGSEGGE